MGRGGQRKHQRDEQDRKDQRHETPQDEPVRGRLAVQFGHRARQGDEDEEGEGGEEKLRAES